MQGRGGILGRAHLPPAPFLWRGTGGKDASTSNAPYAAGVRELPARSAATRRRLAPTKEAAPAFFSQSSVLSRQTSASAAQGLSLAGQSAFLA